MDAEIEILGAIFKPGELARQFRKRNPSIDWEWDFSRCPANETSECLFWEYTREIPSIKQWVKKLRASCAEKTFDGFHRAYGSRIMSFDLQKKPQTFFAKFYFAPEWPDNAYLSVDAKERRRRLIQPDTAGKIPSDIVQVWPVFAKLYLDKEFFEKLERAIRETGKPTIYYNTNSTDAIFNIRWDFSDQQLKKAFASWLEDNRPKGTRANRRGEGQSSIKTDQTALRQLAAWRLLENYELPCATAEELTRKKNDEPLYSGQDYWLAAKREAENRLRGMTDFAAGRHP
jgi:hypothetical protein